MCCGDQRAPAIEFPVPKRKDNDVVKPQCNCGIDEWLALDVGIAQQIMNEQRERADVCDGDNRDEQNRDDSEGCGVSFAAIRVRDHEWDHEQSLEGGQEPPWPDDEGRRKKKVEPDCTEKSDRCRPSGFVMATAALGSHQDWYAPRPDARTITLPNGQSARVEILNA